MFNGEATAITIGGEESHSLGNNLLRFTLPVNFLSKVSASSEGPGLSPALRDLRVQISESETPTN
jgi:hypothetical protein